MKLELMDVKFFNAIMNIFSNKNQSTLKITKEIFQIVTSDSHRYFISLEDKFFKLSSDDEIEFSINTHLLYKQLQNLTFLGEKQDKLIILLENSTFIIHKTMYDLAHLKITIPFINTIHYDFDEIGDFKTKFLLKDGRVLHNFHGIVNYTIENNNLVISRELEEAREEIELYDIKFINDDFILDFTCNNSWVDIFDVICDFVSEILFVFSENILSVSFLLKNYENSYFEVQIPRCLV